MSKPNEYLVGSVIGQGSFAHVLYARHKTTQREVAIKVVEQITLKRRQDVMKMVLTERKILHELNSPFVVSLLASFYDSECVYLVMDLASAGDFYSFIKLGLRKENEERWRSSIPYYSNQIIQAIEYIHSKEIIHCDLKPQNILCEKHGTLKLADFGSCLTNSRMTPSMIVPRGTSEYSSPELIKAENNLSVAVDLWSVGCILYAMFRGDSPFHGESEALSVKLVMEYKNTQSRPLLNTGDDDFSGQWKTLIVGLLDANQPHHRIQVWEEILTLAKEWGKPDDLLLPEAPWRKDVESSEMRDGALGWAAFEI